MEEKEPVIDVTPEDFENITDEDIAAAFAESSKAFEVKQLVKGMFFYCLMPSNKIYMLPLGISMEHFEAMSEFDQVDAIEGFKALFRAFAPSQLVKLEREPIQCIMNMMELYGKAVSRVQGASLGE